ncbi:MAG: Hpt domain-containing protein, partial [Thermodesulfobacteriota bacterium]|nr:Hpt domain-containing protein [Thermodesulfobacteriota bacterium]
MMDKTKFYKKFREIAGDRIRKLNELFLDLEKDATDGERLKNISIELHSLKGEARMIGFEKTNLLLHRLEDLLGSVREGRVSFHDHVSDLFFGILDSVDRLVDLAIEGREDEFELEKIFLDIDILIQGDPPKKEVKETDHGEIMPLKDKIPPAPVAIMEDTIRIDLKKLDSLGNLAGQVVINKIGIEEILKRGRNLLGELRIQNKLWVKIKEDLDEYKDELG